MNKPDKEQLLTEIYEYLNAKYGVAMEDVKTAAKELGLIKARLEAYFLVRQYESKKKRNYPGLNDLSGM